MSTSHTPLSAWLRAATPAERDDLAQRVGTSTQYLGHLAADETKKYKREAKPALAAAIERETLAMSKETRGRLPVVWRTDLNGTCRQCSFAQRCLRDVATRSEFPIVEVPRADA